MVTTTDSWHDFGVSKSAPAASTSSNLGQENILSAGPVDYDVIIVGAGIAGINTAYYLQERGPSSFSAPEEGDSTSQHEERTSIRLEEEGRFAQPQEPTQDSNLTYAILENRNAIGGTWDLFRYPGIRSDSDIFTFGFSWNPWPKSNPLASGEDITSYLKASAAKHGIENKIRYRTKVVAADWCSEQKRWSVKVVERDSDEDEQGHERNLTTRFLILGTGYYNYEEPLPAVIPGLSKFRGTVVQPQFWPADLDYTGKDMIIIGSGATAITILPVVAPKAHHVTMLQRSPGYIMSLPDSTERTLVPRLRKLLPPTLAQKVLRGFFLFVGGFMYWFCQTFPQAARQLLQTGAARQLPPTISVDPHFKPHYNPWDQRLCVCPKGDFYEALRSGRASVVTDTIREVTSDGIKLATSDRELKADIIVVATGLKLQFAGGIKFSVDGERIDPAEKFSWKTTMIQDMPNLFFVMGYVNASWTLGAEVAGMLIMRVLNLLRQNGVQVATPRLEHPEELNELPVLELKSTYVKEAVKVFPKRGDGKWGQKRVYLWDYLDATWGDLGTDLEFS